MRSPLVRAAALFINKSEGARCANISANFEGGAKRAGRWLVTRFEPGYFDDEELVAIAKRLGFQPKEEAE